MKRYLGVTADKPTDHTAYVLPIRIFSQDDNSEERRCGVLTFTRKIANQWFGFTCFQIFTDTWKPNTWRPNTDLNPKQPFGTLFDTTANVIGKPCFQFEWSTERTYDITTNHVVMKNVRKIGVVVEGMPKHNMLAIKLDQDFIDTRQFQEDGEWFRFSEYFECFVRGLTMDLT